jgi:hypothetical protein
MMCATGKGNRIIALIHKMLGGSLSDARSIAAGSTEVLCSVVAQDETLLFAARFAVLALTRLKGIGVFYAR